MSKKVESPKRSSKRASLGRGLGSLLGESSFDESSVELPEIHFSSKSDSALKEGIVEERQQPSPQVSNAARIWQISIDKINPNEQQPRKVFSKEDLNGLSKSIKEQGIIQPILARKVKNGRIEIIAGERRWRAAQAAGLQEVPVILKETDDQKALELALIENIQRQDLTPIEEALAYNYLLNEYGLTQQQLADKLGKERVTIANLLRLLNLSSEVKDMLVSGEITLGQAKVLLMLSDPLMQKKVALKVVKGKLTVRATENLIKKLLNTNKKCLEEEDDEKERFKTKLIKDLSDQLQKMMGTKVSIDYSKNKGKLSIYYYSEEELNKIVENLRQSWRN